MRALAPRNREIVVSCLCLRCVRCVRACVRACERRLLLLLLLLLLCVCVCVRERRDGRGGSGFVRVGVSGIPHLCLRALNA